jgi:hypothetical protein
MNDEKPFNGTLTNWSRAYVTDEGLGYIVVGIFVDHPQFAGRAGHTSWVVKYDEETGEIETRNSRYKLEGPEQFR